MPISSDVTPMHWRLMRHSLRRVLKGAARRVLLNRSFADEHGEQFRWISSDLNRFMGRLEAEADEIRPYAELEKLLRFGNRLVVELAVYTAAAYNALRAEGVPEEQARTAIADTGWDVYRRMLGWAAMPARFLTRDPGRRLRWTIKLLLKFPFSAPGYAVKTWRDGDDIQTHFTHCPPQAFIRRLSEAKDDPGILDAFSESWCLYDWPGADVVAGDGQRGHYSRPHTLSRGNSVCDMCWKSVGHRRSPLGDPSIEVTDEVASQER